MRGGNIWAMGPASTLRAMFATTGSTAAAVLMLVTTFAERTSRAASRSASTWARTRISFSIRPHRAVLQVLRPAGGGPADGRLGEIDPLRRSNQRMNPASARRIRTRPSCRLHRPPQGAPWRRAGESRRRLRAGDVLRRRFRRVPPQEPLEAGEVPLVGGSSRFGLQRREALPPRPDQPTASIDTARAGRCSVPLAPPSAPPPS